MVQGQHQDRLAAAALQQGSSQQRSPRQIEGSARIRSEQSPPLRLGERRGQAGQVHQGQVQGGRPRDTLQRPAIHLREAGAQDLVPAHDLSQGGIERGPVELPLKPHWHRHVVGEAAGLELVEEPEALLGEGKGRLVVLRRTRERMPQAERHSGARRPCSETGGSTVQQDFGQTRDGRRIEQRRQRHFPPEGLLHPRHELGGQQRMAAQLEKVIVRSDARDAKHLGPQSGEDLFHRGARRHVLGRVAEPFRIGQGPAIHLAIGCQR